MPKERVCHRSEWRRAELRKSECVVEVSVVAVSVIEVSVVEVSVVTVNIEKASVTENECYEASIRQNVCPCSERMNGTGANVLWKRVPETERVLWREYCRSECRQM